MLRPPEYPAPEPERPTPIKNQFPVVFRPGKSYLLVGKRGTGKSFTLSGFSSAALTFANWVVASNVPIQMFNPDIVDFVDGVLDGYRYVDNYLNLFEVIELALRTGRNVFFAMDEGSMGESFQSGETRVKGTVRDSITFTNIARHLNVSTVIASQSIEDIGTAWREWEGGKLDAIIDKPPQGEFAGYSSQEIVRFTDHAGRTAVRYVPPYGLAHDVEWAREHPWKPVYVDTISGFTLGRYPGTGMAFPLRDLMNAMIGKRPSQYPDIIRRFLSPPPDVGRERGPRISAAAAEMSEKIDRVDRALADLPKGPTEPEKEALLRCYEKGMSVKDAMLSTGAGRTWAYDVYREYKTGVSTEARRLRSSR